MTEVQVKKYPHCFGCGDANPIGLRLKLRMEGDHLVTEFLPKEEHQGWPDIVHGGIISALLYEVLENLPYYQGAVTMMKSMETKLRSPAKIGQRIVARSWPVERTGRNMGVSATLTNEQGDLIAEGNAILVALSQSRKERLGLSLEEKDHER